MAKYFFLLFSYLIFWISSPCLSHDPSTLTSPAAPQVKELLGTLSKLVDNKEEKEEINTTNTVSVKIDDLKSAVKILENPGDRKKVATALKGLIKLQETEEKKESLIQKASLNITGTIETTTEVLLRIFGMISQVPDFFMTQFEKFLDQKYRTDFMILLTTLLLSIGVAIIVEYFVRRLLFWLKIHRPTEFIFKKIPIHVTRNVTPVILFGLVGYTGIYLSQGGWTPITFHGFYVMTFIVMVRTFWLVLRVLFISRPKQFVAENSTLETSLYHFLLAVFQVIIIGIVFAEMTVFLNMGKLAYQLWLRIIGFGVTSLLIIGIIKIRYIIWQYFKYDEDGIDGGTLYLAKMIELIGRYWQWIISSWLAITYVLWLTQFNEVAILSLTSLISVIFLTVFFLFGRVAIIHLIHNFQEKLKKNKSTIAVSSLGYLEGSVGRGIIFMWHIIYFILILETCGAEPLHYLSHSKTHPYVTSIITILITFFIIRALWLWINYMAKIQMSPKKMGRRLVEPSQFIKTLTPIIKNLAHWFLCLMTIILVMTELNIPVEPILYFFGFFGIAISFASQSLVKDLINGILNLMEGNIVVGEVITIGTNTGTVETLSLRGLSLRHSNGSLQSITFSEITNIINKSRNYTVVPVEITVPYHTDIGVVHKVLLSAYTDICKDAIFGSQILDPLTISGIDRFHDNGFTVMGNIKVRPDPKNRFLRAFNQCLKVRLEQENILPPASQKVISINIEQEPNLPALSNPISPSANS